MEGRSKIPKQEDQVQLWSHVEASVLDALIGTFGTGLIEFTSKKLRVGLLHNGIFLKVMIAEHDYVDYPCGEAHLDEKVRAIAVQTRLLMWESARLSDGLRTFVPKDGHSTLKRVDFCGAGLSEKAAKWIGKALSKNPCLELLDLSNNMLGDAGVSFVAKGLRKNNLLRFLMLSCVGTSEEPISKGFLDLFKGKPKHLEGLDVSCNKFGSKKAFSRLVDWLSSDPKLTWLSLRLTDVSNSDDCMQMLSETIKPGMHLKRLLLTESSLSFPVVEELEIALWRSHFSFAQLVTSNPRLKLVSLRMCSVQPDDINVILESCRSLETLMYESCGPVDCRSLKEALQKNDSLCQLSVYSGDIADNACSVLLEGVSQKGCLNKLDLGRNQLSAASARLFFDMKVNNLRVLSVANNPLGDEGAKWISAWLEEGAQLIELNLSGCSISAVGVKHLARALTSNRILQNLFLGYNEFSDEGVIVLAPALEANSTLKWLVLSYVGMTELGARALAASLCSNTSLTCLDASDHNEIGLQGYSCFIRMLQVNTSIKELYFDGANTVGLNALLDRNLSLRIATKRAVFCFLWCCRFRNTCPIGQLDPQLILRIAKLIWTSRSSGLWLRAVILLGLSSYGGDAL